MNYLEPETTLRPHGLSKGIAAAGLCATQFRHRQRCLFVSYQRVFQVRASVQAWRCLAFAVGRVPLLRPIARSSDFERLVLDPVRLISISAEAAFFVSFVVLEIALKPDHLALPFEGEHMCRDTV